MKVLKAKTTRQIEEIRLIFREYYEELLKIDTCFKDFETELADLPGVYAPPDGTLLLAYEGQEVAGCVALRKVEDGMCEMKRLFVRSKYQGQGRGRVLTEKIINEAVKIGYSSMRLDTLDWLKEAMSLYESLGFKQIEPYDDNPHPALVYWKLNLKNSI